MFVVCVLCMVKQTCKKIHDPSLHATILHELKCLMFDGKGPISDGTIGWTIQKVKNLMTKHPQAHLF